MLNEPAARFWRYVNKTANGCWLWTGGQSGKGYGVFALNGKSIGAHRAAYILSRGPIPEGMMVCHQCDTPGCVRPEHLFLGTQKDNMQDAARKGRIQAGDMHFTHRHPELVVRGDRHGMRLHPERVARGDAHYLRQHPELSPTVRYPEIIRRGEDHHNAKLTEAQVREILAKSAIGVPQRALAAQYRVSRALIRAIQHRKAWAHVDCPKAADWRSGRRGR